MKTDLNAVLAAVVVVATVLVFLLLGVKTYTHGTGLDAGWGGVFLLVFGAVVGRLRAHEKQKAADAQQAQPPPAVEGVASESN
ncbi:hypothetical protein V3W47_19045 [Deinococcus sp. YIM 134068]|uniref:hypothetical protein n=1 Tax=Deinococcus lichenicola TaxID=3118910 RepID=UPI002F9406BD